MLGAIQKEAAKDYGIIRLTPYRIVKSLPARLVYHSTHAAPLDITILSHDLLCYNGPASVM